MSNGSTVRLAFDEQGSGDPPLVLLHGFPLDRTMWHAQVAGLAGHARIIAPDLRGLGASPVHGPWSMDHYADDVVSILDALRIERAVIGGFSMGGYVTFAMWRRHRDRFAGMLLVDTRATADTDETRAKRREQVALVRERGAGPLADQQVTGLLGKTTRERNPAIVEAARTMMGRAPVDGIVGALEAMMARPDSTPELGTITVPTLIVVGDEDVITPPKESRAMQAQIPRAELALIGGAGHLAPMEKPAAFNAIVVDWLGRLRST